MHIHICMNESRVDGWMVLNVKKTDHFHIQYKIRLRFRPQHLICINRTDFDICVQHNGCAFDCECFCFVHLRVFPSSSLFCFIGNSRPDGTRSKFRLFFDFSFGKPDSNLFFIQFYFKRNSYPFG